MKTFVLLCIFFAAVFARTGFGPNDQDWGWITVRARAHMFWWLHYTTATQDPLERPLILWLQGGPGDSSTGFGNLAEIGPLDADLNPRNLSWTNYANVLFVDNPVGAGYSYAEYIDDIATSNFQATLDLLEFLTQFFDLFPEFHRTPFYIFSEHYGGKLAVEIALRLNHSINIGEVTCNFKGIALGDPWISPIDTMLTWAPYLLNIGAIDKKGFKAINEFVEQAQTSAYIDDFVSAQFYYIRAVSEIASRTANIDIHNFLTKVNNNTATDDIATKIATLMNGDVKTALKLPSTVIWDRQGSTLYNQMVEEFIKPDTEKLTTLLNDGYLKVVVYQGQLDPIVTPAGTLAWMDKLVWNDLETWLQMDTTAFSVDGVNEGYEKKLGNFAMYWVNRAGHNVPADNPVAMLHILEDVTNNFEV